MLGGGRALTLTPGSTPVCIDCGSTYTAARPDLRKCLVSVSVGDSGERAASRDEVSCHELGIHSTARTETGIWGFTALHGQRQESGDSQRCTDSDRIWGFTATHGQQREPQNTGDSQHCTDSKGNVRTLGIHSTARIVRGISENWGFTALHGQQREPQNTGDSQHCTDRDRNLRKHQRS